MSSWVSYQGKPLGTIRLDDTNTNKFVFVAESLESLAQLFSLKPSDEIEIEGASGMTYETFTQTHLKDISGFYPSREHWLLKNERALKF